MRAAPRWIRTGAGLALLSTVGCSGSPPMERQETAVEVRNLVEGYLDLVEARDTSAIRDLLDDGDPFVWIEDGRLRYRSVDQVLDGLAAFPAESRPRTELDGLTVAPLGPGGAHAYARFTTTVGQGPGSYSFGGVISFLAERVEGEWRIAGGHVSSGRGDGGRDDPQAGG